mgnify:CR=1 FL=1
MKPSFFLLAGLAFAHAAFAAQSSLDEELGALALPDETPAPAQSVRYQIVQDRSPELARRVALSVGAGQFVSGNGYLSTRTIGAAGTFYFDNKIGASVGYSKVNNKFTSSADRLQKTNGFLPDVDYAKSRFEATGLYNLLYGKFRVSRNTAFIFDQYFELGLALNSLSSGTAVGPVGGAGLVFWLNRFNFRVSVKDYYYGEKSVYTEGSYHNIVLGTSAGVLF